MRHLSSVICCLALVSIPFAAAYAAAPQSPRVVLNFNTDWLYAPADVVNGQVVSADESGFSLVCLPHANKPLALHRGIDIQSFRFVSWYRRHFTLPREYSGRRVAVAFEGVATVARVYVNGVLTGEHQGAYTPFSLDITEQVNFGGADNVIAVRVDAQRHNDIPPEGNLIDYLVFGGIVRDVRLVITAPVAVDWTFVTTPTISADRADVRIETRIVNTGAVAKVCTLQTVLFDKGSQPAGSVASTLQIPAGSADTIRQTVPLASPHLWHPDDPYLYSVQSTITAESGTLDSVSTRTGLRWFAFDKQSGAFSIDGVPFKLRGLDRHEMFPWIGRAAPNRLQARDADILKYELGCNIVRCSHYPQDPAFLDRCDEIGLCAIEEVPGWQYIGDAAWQAKVVANVEAMVVRDRNHPCIVSWGVRINESADNHALYTTTNGIAHTLDPSRPTHGVRNLSKSEFLEDLYTYNDFSGSITDPLVLPWLVTEFAGHTFPTHSWDPEARLRAHMRLHASIQNGSYGNGRVAGALGWCAFDYNTTSDFGEQNVCYHGVADIFRIRKFAGWFYASQRDPARYGPVVYIANYWRASDGDTVFIASNCDSVELSVNGVSRGMKKPGLYTNLPHPLFFYPGIPFTAGVIEATGYISGKPVARHTRRTPGTANRIALEATDSLLSADGGDMTEVVASVLDTNGQIVPGATNRITFALSGPGALYGENPISAEDGKSAFFIQSKLRRTGTITVTASATGLQPATVTVKTVSMADDVVAGGTAVIPSMCASRSAHPLRFEAFVRPGAVLNIPGSLGRQGVISIYDLAGRLVAQRKGKLPQRLDLARMFRVPVGVFIARVKTDRLQ